MRDGSIAVHTTVLSKSVSSLATQSWLGRTVHVAALRSGGNIPADHIQSLSRGHVSEDMSHSDMSCLEASDPERLVSANSVNHFLNTLSLSSLSYISRSSASKLTVDCSSSLSLVTKYGRLIQQAILLSAQLILLTQTTVQLFTNNTSHGFIHEFLCK